MFSSCDRISSPFRAGRIIIIVIIILLLLLLLLLLIIIIIIIIIIIVIIVIVVNRVVTRTFNLPLCMIELTYRSYWSF